MSALRTLHSQNELFSIASASKCLLDTQLPWLDRLDRGNPPFSASLSACIFHSAVVSHWTMSQSKSWTSRGYGPKSAKWIRALGYFTARFMITLHMDSMDLRLRFVDGNFFCPSHTLARFIYSLDCQDQDASWIRHQVIQAAETAQIHPFIVGLPHGYDTIIGVNGLGLSGGQRQQLAVARAIVSKPAILLLDEATAALDSQSEKEMQGTLSRAMVGRSTIVIAHRLSTVKDADRTIVLQDGRVVNQGSHKQLLSESAMYQELVRQQTLRSRDRFDGDQKPDEKLSARNPKDPVEKISIEPVSANILENPSSSSTSRNSVGLVWSLNKPEAYYIVAGIIFSILAGITYPIQAIFFGNGIISIINPQLSTAGQTVHFWALAYLIHGIVVFAIYCIRGYCFAVSASELSLRARSSLFECLVLKNLPFFETQDHLVGTLVCFLTSGTQRIIGISGTSLGLVAESTIMLATGIVKLGLAAMAIIPLIVISGFLQYYIVAQVQKCIKHQVNAVAVAHEAFSAIRVVTIFNLQTTVIEAFTRARDRDNQGCYWVMAAAMYACTTTLRILSIAFVFWFGGVHLIATGEYDVQQFFVCFAAAVWGTQSASALFAHAPDIAGAHAAAQQLQEYMQDSTMEQFPKKNPNPNNDNRSVSAVTDYMTMEHVRFGYPTHPFQLTLDDVSLDIPAGTFVALVGATGSGKSSVINLLSRFYSPESGNITLGGNPIHEYDLDDYYGYLALVDQNPCLIGQDLRECLQSDDRDVSDDDILEALRSVGLAGFVASLPQGLNTPVSANGSTLSGGQRQRMAIAKALLWKPKIL